MHMIDILVQPAIFMSLYYTLTLPEIKFVDYYIGTHLISCRVSLSPCSSGYLISITSTICLLSGMFTHISKADYAVDSFRLLVEPEKDYLTGLLPCTCALLSYSCVVLVVSCSLRHTATQVLLAAHCKHAHLL